MGNLDFLNREAITALSSQTADTQVTVVEAFEEDGVLQLVVVVLLVDPNDPTITKMLTRSAFKFDLAATTDDIKTALLRDLAPYLPVPEKPPSEQRVERPDLLTLDILGK